MESNKNPSRSNSISEEELNSLKEGKEKKFKAIYSSKKKLIIFNKSLCFV